MGWRGLALRVFGLWMAFAPLFGFAQIQSHVAGVEVDSSGNAKTVEAALHQMSDAAAVVFIGTVADVHRSQSAGIGGGFVEIRFDVEQAIRGINGSTYLLREWGGFWTANDSRYRVGQHLLLLLHAPGATGLSSPVGGMDGAIPLRPSGSGIRSTDFSNATSDQVADLRWIAAKLPRTVVYRKASASQPSAALPAAPPTIGLQKTVAEVIVPPNGSDEASRPAQESSVSEVVAMLRSWKGKTDATR